MSKHHFKRDNCRLCHSKRLELVVPIAATPIADAYVPKEKLDEVQELYPLDMYQCLDCGHVQLLDVVDPEVIFKHYSYFSGRTAAIVKHFDGYSDAVIRKTNLQPGSLVVDVGSNDGCLLRHFQNKGMKVLGIDPAENIAKAANESGVETVCDFFNFHVAKRLSKERGRAKVLTANNVFAHIDDLGGIADAVRTFIDDDGVFVFEVSYLLDVIDHMLLGTIFHEHLCYHSVRPLDAFLRLHGMELIDIERNNIQGGSIVCMAQPLNGPRKANATVAELKALEDERRVHDPATLRAFSGRLEDKKNETATLLKRLHAEGKTIAGFGAARGGTLLIYHFGLNHLLSFIVDDSPDKQGMFSPGDHIPVYPVKALYEKKPECAFILAWVHSKPIVQNHQKYLEQGGQFITCFPRITVLNKENPTL
jgi:SAM-dependent methyltransferase